MNQRIKELLKQSSYRIIETDGAPIICQDLNPEKFAELIVKECVARIQGCHLTEDGRTGEFELGYAKAIDKASSQVLLHFGVAE